MNDLATLKSLTNILPIATLGNQPREVAFNRFKFERLSAHGSVENGIVLTINDDAFEDVEEWMDYIRSPIGVQTVHRTATAEDLQSLSLAMPANVLRLRNVTNYVTMLTDDKVVFRFVTARWRGVDYPIEELNRYFTQLRLAYYLSDEVGVIDLQISLGSVNHRYTSKHQIEDILYTMAYHFFREDTEL